MAQGKIWQHEATQTPTPECQAPNTMIMQSRTTHPPKQVLSLCENPPDEVTDELSPPNMTIDKIAYHTPAEVGAFALHKPPLHEKQMYTATHHPTQEPSTQTPAISMSMVNIWYHTPTAAGTFALCKNSPARKMDLIYGTTPLLQQIPFPCAKTPLHKKWMCEATHNPIQEPSRHKLVQAQAPGADIELDTDNWHPAGTLQGPPGFFNPALYPVAFTPEDDDRPQKVHATKAHSATKVHTSTKVCIATKVPLNKMKDAWSTKSRYHSASEDRANDSSDDDKYDNGNDSEAQPICSKHGSIKEHVSRRNSDRRASKIKGKELKAHSQKGQSTDETEEEAVSKAKAKGCYDLHTDDSGEEEEGDEDEDNEDEDDEDKEVEAVVGIRKPSPKKVMKSSKGASQKSSEGPQSEINGDFP
ncbi:hypothetical protein BS47DRAFT_1369162 [Hydnum rufescens UP504]|uniref:Uncharacterized protein n=1 Tax=Hydnum rufescens UP504 TaxID=1448309 RepID=A0A9P6DHI7_9AGAM|nr:hypothetical protein BS47DRAFT_1369162 [Hydnum rufescens UP504]